ncbi:glycosyltransferase [Agromyces sp. CCNWLW213]|uniref:glycosyltransferase n=1 Tax=Agromyces sp. CCNWLW213 TaxID=3128541 RepID=UPI003075F2A2
MSVIIPVRKADVRLLQQLQALCCQSDAPVFDVVVVANGDYDGIADLVRSATREGVRMRVVDGSQRRGVSYARNVGAAHARGAILLFCDGDDVVDSKWVSEMNRALKDHAVVSGALDLKRLNRVAVRAWSVESPGAALPRSMGYLPYAVGANMGVRAEAYRVLAGCDESYIGGHEEVDFAWRAQEAGYSIGFAKDAVVHYRLRPTMRALFRQRYNSGRTYSQLYANYRSRIALRTSPAREAQIWLEVIRRLARARDAVDLGRVVRMAGWHLGRLVGGVRYFAMGPDDSGLQLREEA